MLRNYDNTYHGNIDFNIDRKAIESLVTFLDINISKFPGFLKQINTLLVNEDGITSKLEIFLQRQARQGDQIFMFQFQTPLLNTKRTTDISVVYTSLYSSTEPFFLIEAKRLPTPGNGSREREYVQGNHGAIERFKRSQHGKGLEISAVLGYIEDNNSFEHWQKKVCSWITDLINLNSDATIDWTNNDLLSFVENFSSSNKYNSLHSRRTDCDINLIHYWVNVN
ncbi:MAG TPA: hypothetical protein PLP23_11905 [Panacibacter sp.]|nr:hypothetical protein [Panacibacter sp.]